jgi:hypothetical protein
LITFTASCYNVWTNKILHKEGFKQGVRLDKYLDKIYKEWATCKAALITYFSSAFNILSSLTITSLNRCKENFVFRQFKSVLESVEAVMRDKFNSVSISQSDIKSSLKSGAINNFNYS